MIGFDSAIRIDRRALDCRSEGRGLMERLLGRWHMSRFALISALAVAVAGLGGRKSSTCGAPPTLNPCTARVKVLEWFSTLGFPDVRNAQFVRFPSSASQSRGEAPECQFGHGFLLTEDNQEWTILTVGLEQRAVAKQPPFREISTSYWTCQKQKLTEFTDTILTTHAEVHEVAVHRLDMLAAGA
jgi:hypothetical protein